jgi:hypothetical protein
MEGLLVVAHAVVAVVLDAHALAHEVAEQHLCAARVRVRLRLRRRLRLRLGVGVRVRVRVRVRARVRVQG